MPLPVVSFSQSRNNNNNTGNDKCQLSQYLSKQVQMCIFPLLNRQLHFILYVVVYLGSFCRWQLKKFDKNCRN